MLELLQSLAIAIDARDAVGPDHIPKVRARVAALAAAMDLPAAEREALDRAAIVHDVGKLVVPARILTKPGPLSPEEFGRIRLHPAVGAALVEDLGEDIAAIVGAHHERWDGRGYPLGLRGEAIPLGARVFTVADYFEALITTRPYHKAMSLDEAADVLRAEAGKALDPLIVRTFLERVPLQMSGVPLVAQPTTVLAFAQIAEAERQSSVLHELARALAGAGGVPDTMAEVSARLPALVPHDAMALFLLDDEGEELRCRIASGVDAEAFQQVRLRVGDGLVGWVARNRRALVNARPSADLEASGLAMDTMLQSALAVPLMVERCIGVLVLYHVRAGHYADAHRSVLDDVADLIAPAIARAARYEQVIEDALTDEVSGLPNARFLAMHITRELARAERLDTEVAIVVVDLDGFTAIRRRHGRATANRVLREVATEIRRWLRPCDVAIRYESDEFIVTLSGCGREEALEQARELQGAVDTVWIESDGERVPVAGSVGVGVYPHDGRTFDAVLAVTEGRIWVDKRQRRQ